MINDTDDNTKRTSQRNGRRVASAGNAGWRVEADRQFSHDIETLKCVINRRNTIHIPTDTLHSV